MQPIMERNKASGCIMAIDDPERYLSWLGELPSFPTEIRRDHRYRWGLETLKH